MANEHQDTSTLLPLPELLPLEQITPPQDGKLRLIEANERPLQRPVIEEEPPFITVERHYPRIAAAIHLMWGNAELEDYLDKLIVTDRGGREGFPVEVHKALLKLYNQHASLFNFRRPADVWAYDPLAIRQSLGLLKAGRRNSSMQAA